jgi:predicted ATPase/DNA-binding winged helix-turn-helix (wHTH) protein
MDLLRIGPFEVYPSERLLRAEGTAVEIGARAFDLLLVLAENPGRLVTKAALIERVWPRLVVDENNLPTQIASLRRVLGAGAIRTVPRFGYRLDLPVSRAPVVDGAPATAPGRGQETVPDGAVRAGTLIGRAADLEAIRDALARDRLVTLVGAAGVGKSRLAQEVIAIEAERRGIQGRTVALEPLDAAERLPSAIALAVGVPLPEGGDRFEGLGRALEGSREFIVLDGAEHLAGGIAESLAALAAQAPELRILVTSQTPLGRMGETVYRLNPLPVDDAVRLFAQRAAQADQRFELGSGNAATVEEICRRLDGNPLAVELAAARVASFGLAALLAHLDDRFRLLKLSGNAAGGRHGVLQAAFDWSYRLLGGSEQRVFDRLGSFPGSFSLDAAAHSVADDAIDVPGAIDLVGRLVDRSLVTMLPGEPARFSLLETARCYARSRLEATGATAESSRGMARATLRLLDRAYEAYWSVDEALWLHEHEPELDNVRAALEWARSKDPALAVALYASAWPLFVEADLQEEGRAAHADAVALLNDAMLPARLARFWEAVAAYDSERQFDRARYAAELAAGLYGKSGDARGQAYALMQLALNWRDDLEGAGRALATARRLQQPSWPTRLLAHGAIVEGALLASAGRFAESRASYRRALDHALAASERQALAATVHIVELDIACDALPGALQLARPLAMSLRHSGRRETRQELLVLLCGALLLAGEVDEARAAGVELLDLSRRLGFGKLYLALDAMALLAARGGHLPLAARMAVAAESAHAGHGQSRRRPAAERVRAALHAALDSALGSGWRDAVAGDGGPLDEEDACLRALGLRPDA